MAAILLLSIFVCFRFIVTWIHKMSQLMWLWHQNKTKYGHIAMEIDFSRYF